MEFEWRKRLVASCLLTAVLQLVTACGGDEHLSQSRAQSAIDEWLQRRGASGTVEVLGIKEVPQENAANADLKMKSFTWSVESPGIVPGLGALDNPKRVTSDPGVAIFTHYNDGRWVLTKVAWLYGSFEDSPNIVVH